MFKKVLLVSLLSLFIFESNAQSIKDHDHSSTPIKRTCKTKIPPIEWENDFQQHIANYLANQNNSANRLLADYTIPVVVHVVYWTATQNISQAQVNSQLSVLNKDYAGIGLNVGNVPAAFSSLISNTNIQFCLAQKKPDGSNMAEPGINRVNAQTSGFTNPGNNGWTDTYIDNTVKPATIWDPTKYLNIWVLPLEDGTLGYATFPASSTLSGIPGGSTGSSQDDGVVIGYLYFGDNTGTVVGSAPYNRGRTLTHEVGHWLGLRHIWGDGFCATDYCNDTPTQGSANYDCPSFPKTSCSNGPNGEMFMNFMDYTDDACMYMFTPDQRTRMQTAMANGTYRLPLANSTVCTSTPQAPVANFTANRTSVCPGNTVTFTDQSTNTPTSWSWTFPGGTPSSSTAQNPTVTYNTPGTYNVTLVATNSLGNNSHTKSNYITVAAPTGSALQFTEGFQSTTFAPTGWALSSVSGFNWKRTASAGGFGASTASMYFDNFNDNPNGAKDDILTPTINLSNSTSPRIKFDVAYAPYLRSNGTSKMDTIEVLITDVCAGTTTSIYKKGGTQLATAAANANAFFPTANQWRQDSVNIPAPYQNKYVKFTFRNYGLYANNVFIDNVNIYSVGASSPTATASFTLSDTTVCPGGSLTFTNTSTASSGSPDSVRWTINGGVPSTSNSTTTVTATFNTVGTYTISLVAYKSGNASAVFSRTIRVKPRPTVTVNSPTICSGSTATLTASGATTYTWSPNIGTSATVTTPTLTSTTTYTVTGTTSGCTNTAIATVTVTPLPNVTVNSPTICSGNSASLTASGATNYSWSPNIGSTATVNTPVLTSTTTYTVTGTSNNCSKTAVATVTVTPLPNVTVNSPTICTGQTATLTASGATSYSWSPNIGSTATVTTPALTTTTSYIVTGTSSNCSKTATATVTVVTTPNISVTSPTICSGKTATITASGGNTYTWSPNIGSSATVTTPVLTSNTTYTVTGFIGNCSKTAVSTVTVNPNPTVSVNSPSICSGTSATLSASGASTFTWSPNIGITATVTTPTLTSTTNYTVTGTIANGCTGTAISTVTVKPLPATPTITQSNDTLYSSVIIAGASYEWYKAGVLQATTTTAYYKFSSGGIYTVKIINNGCASAMSANFNAVLTAVLSKKLNVDFVIFPNPNNGQFEIRITSRVNKTYRLSLLNTIGQEISSEELDIRVGYNTKLIQFFGLEKGMYFLSISGDDGIAVQNIMIQ